MPANDLTDLTARALSREIHARRISCREVMQAYLARIHRLNPTLNAIVNLAPDASLLGQADACDAELAQGRSRGWLHGLPQAIKDTGHALGFPSTVGSPLLKDVMPTQDSLVTARAKAAGAIVIGKTNVPELALGSHTFNPLFGATANAWDASVSAGGSSGGAAVALARRSFRWEGFGGVEDTANHLLGAALMGVGGVTALGCTIGQGLSGLSTLSLGSFIALAAIFAGAVVALRWQVWRMERSL